MTEVTIYHNPNCSKSRQTLALLKDKGIKINVVSYLDQPLDADTLQNIIHLLDVNAIDIIRKGESDFKKEMADWSQERQIALIIEHPILMQRPIVVANGKARIGRPPEAILEIL